MTGIYKITNPKNRVYIGQSVDINRRFNQYKTKLAKSQVKLNRSFLKYGFENHKFEVICTCDVKELDELEIYFIDLFNSIECGLNAKGGGSGGYMPKELRDKISKSHKGKKLKESTKIKLREINKANPVMKGKKHLFCTLYKMRLAGLKRKHTKETREKISKIQRINPQTAKPVIDVNTGVFYKSPREVAELYGYNLVTLRAYLNGSLPNKTNFVYA